MVDDNCDARSAVLDSKGAILLGTTEIATQQKQHDTKCDKCMEKDNDEESRALEGLDTGWAWVVLIASFWTFFMVGGTMYANGIMHVALMERYNESVSLTSWAGALHTGMFSLARAFVLAASICGAFSKIFERRNMSEEYAIEIELKKRFKLF